MTDGPTGFGEISVIDIIRIFFRIEIDIKKSMTSINLMETSFLCSNMTYYNFLPTFFPISFAFYFHSFITWLPKEDIQRIFCILFVFYMGKECRKLLKFSQKRLNSFILKDLAGIKIHTINKPVKKKTF